MVNIETNNWSDFFPLPEIEKERLEDTGHLSLVACYLYPYGCPSIFSRDQPLDRDVHEAKAKHQVTHDGLLKMLARVDGRAECAGDAEALSNFLDKEVNTGKKPKKPGGHTPKKSKQKASRGQK